MVQSIQSRSRTQIRESIGYNLNDMMLVVASSTCCSGSVVATYSLARGGDDEYNGRQLVMITPTGSIAAGEKSFISDFDATYPLATVVPVFTDDVTDEDIFEMWKVFTYEEINEAINQTIAEATDDCPQIKQTVDTFTAGSTYEYDCLSSFISLHKVEYSYSVGREVSLDKADDAWTAGSANVTVTADTAFKKEGTASMKAVEDGNSGAGAILCYEAIPSTDLDDKTKVEFWMYSSIALTAGQLQIKLDDTAAIASALEAIDIPAMDAGKWYRHSLTLANPHTDVDIISIGIYQVSDVGTFTFYVDDVMSNDPLSRQYRILPADMWSIARDSTNYLKFTPHGLGLMGNNKLLRLTGFQIPSLLSSDSSISEIDPAWIIAKTTGRLLISHAKSNQLDVKDKESLSRYWLGEAERRLVSIRTNLPPNHRSVL